MTSGGSVAQVAPKNGTFERDAGERFVLGNELGRGGMGRVVAASDAALDRPVALKQLLSDRPEDRARFEREVRITARLEHPAIVPVHEAGRDAAGRPFYVMRRIEGQSLAIRLARAADLNERLALLPSMLAIADAAAFAHSRGVIHRDIKPANIMLGDYGEALLIDWGLARRIGEEAGDTGDGDPTGTSTLTRAGDICGTVAYLPPEQGRGEPVDERADVYALGATLYHVLTGSAPFGNLSLHERLARDIDLAKMPPGAPRELVTIVRKATAADAEGRYPSASGLATDLRAFLAGQLVAAHRYTPFQRVVRFVRRHRVAVSIVSVAIVAAAAFAVASVGGIVAARDREVEAKLEAQRSSNRAEDRAEAALLERAYALVDRHPTHAALLLRKLRPESPHRRRARDVATAAIANGIARGIDLPADGVSHGALSIDGERVAVGGKSSIVVCELATASCSRITGNGVTSGLVWIDGTVVVAGTNGLVELDVVRRTWRTLDPEPAFRVWRGPAGRLRYTTPAVRELREVVRANEPRVTTIARNVELADVDGDLALVYGSRRLRLFDGPREIELVSALEAHPVPHLVISRASGRVRASLGMEVRVWDLTGRELAPLSQSGPVAYAAAMLETPLGVVLSTHTGVRALGAFTSTIAIQHAAGRLAVVPNGYAFPYTNGTVEVRYATAAYELPMKQDVRALIGSEGSPYLVALVAGGVRWWDLRTVILTATPLAETGDLVWADAKYFVTTVPGELRRLDRRTGEVLRRSENDVTSGPQIGLGAIGKTLYLHTSSPLPQSQTLALDLETGSVERFPIPKEVAIDKRGLLYARGDRMVILEDRRERTLWTAPEAIEKFVATERWAVLAGRSWIRRIDRTTGAVTDLPVANERVEVDGGGTVWWSKGAQLEHWDGAFHPPVPLQRAVHQMSGMPSGVALLLDDSSLWVATPSGLAIRSQAGGSKRVAFVRDGRALRFDIDGMTLFFLETDVAISRRIRPTRAVIASGELLVGQPSHVLSWRDLVSDPAELDDWLAGVTNARLDERDAVVWPRVR